ncbi:GNAT family N-acetyltransferase [Pseudactinotalea suaedae]|uniref:GNAT family N-acetyltransferase n=1 Tax=Pseudactinotalea suaedae TaxID=1524924 RepID=UPI0019D6ABBB|nr:GNAT family N-acetyltransferase [Pseudactinotalea suaedae]
MTGAVVRPVRAADHAFLTEHERHISADELHGVIARGRVLVSEVDGAAAGWLRWGLFWDQIPFMNLLMVLEPHRGRGLGRALVEVWERAMAADGHSLVLTSTLATESAQHLYRHLGYVDSGSLLLPGEPTELVLRKELTPA